MVIGVLELGLGLVLVLVPLLVLLLQAARTLTDSTAAPVRAKARLGSQGRLGLTPGSSFLCHPGKCLRNSVVSSPSGTSACSLTRASPADSACCNSSAAKSASPYPRPTRPWMS